MFLQNLGSTIILKSTLLLLNILNNLPLIFQLKLGDLCQPGHHAFNDSDLVPSAEIKPGTNPLSDDKMTHSELIQSQ